MDWVQVYLVVAVTLSAISILQKKKEDFVWGIISWIIVLVWYGPLIGRIFNWW